MAGKMDDPAANKEKAEGERETVDAALRNADSEPENREHRRDQAAGQGITNRPIDEEQDEQRELPPRGAAKREDEDESR